ncbi:hypothetical protein JXA84_01250 [candidate division WOR-3 bacterium]|nr:hypothetical protein [candidate division WOR-3 bacterium]
MFQSLLIAFIGLWLVASALVFHSSADKSNITFGSIIFVLGIIQLFWIIKRENKEKKDK